MYILADFAYKDPNWGKILDKWKSRLSNSSIDKDQYNILHAMKLSVETDKNLFKQKPKLEFLKKTYINPVNNKQQTLVTGIARIPKETSKKVEVEYLAGNPRSKIDNRFKGALDSLDKKVGDRKIHITPINQNVSDLYKNKFGDRLI